MDNEMVYDMIEYAVRGHDVAATIAPFCHAWDERGALLALKSQHAGKAIYDQLGSITLQQHMGLHWKAFVTLSECAEQIPVDVPNERAQVTYLLDSITTTDPNVFAATAAVRQDEVNKRVNFESSFTFLAPTCPVTAKLAKKGRVLFETNVSGTNGKPQGGLGRP
jgi:hypothetical protein